MHSVWTGEHHGMDFTIAPNPFINLADLASRVKTARLGTGTVIAPSGTRSASPARRR